MIRALPWQAISAEQALVAVPLYNVMFMGFTLLTSSVRIRAINIMMMTLYTDLRWNPLVHARWADRASPSTPPAPSVEGLQKVTQCLLH